MAVGLPKSLKPNVTYSYLPVKLYDNINLTLLIFLSY